MAQALTLARPYARAAFETAHAEGKLADWSKALAFAAAVSGDARVHDLLNDPRVQPAQLVSLHLPSLLPEVEELFDELKRESEHTLLVKVTSALALDAAQAETLKASLKRRFKREIEIEAHVDAALLGGVVIDTGDEVIDGSARGRLARLATALTH